VPLACVNKCTSGSRNSGGGAEERTFLKKFKKSRFKKHFKQENGYFCESDN
jgi:hypothetical protein